MSLDQLEARPAARDVEVDFAARCNAQRIPDPLWDGDLSLRSIETQARICRRAIFLMQIGNARFGARTTRDCKP
jgi:hypothetical protein